MSFDTIFRRLTGYLDNPKLISESMAEYDSMTGGNADPTCISPHHTEGRLGVVPNNPTIISKAKEHGARQDKDGGWSLDLKTATEDAIRWFKPLWIKTPADLLAEKIPTRRLPDGSPITDFVLSEDFGTGGESTATPLVFASLPVFAALLMVAIHIGSHINGHLGALLAVVPALGIVGSLFAIEEMFKISGMVKAFLLGVLLPCLMVQNSDGLSFKSLVTQSPEHLVFLALGGLVLMAIGASTLGNSGEGSWSKGLDGLKSLFWIALVFGGVDFAIELLPHIFHAAIWFIPGCLLAVRHADRFWRWRGEELLMQESYGKRMRLMQSTNPTGPVQQAYRNQVIRAARDTSPKFIFGRAKGSLGKRKNSPFFYREGQEVALTRDEMSGHVMIFGQTGAGKTHSWARPTLFKWIHQNCGGSITQCGKGQLPFDVRDLTDIRLEPGFNWAMLQGMDGIQLGAALGAFKPSGRAVKESDSNGSNSHWNDGANLVISHVSYLHDQLHRHEINVRAATRIRMAQQALLALTLDIREMDGVDVDHERQGVVAEQARCQKILDRVRNYSWCYGRVWNTMQACDEVIPQGTKKEIGQKLRKMKNFLGVTEGVGYLQKEKLAVRLQERPETIHAEAQQNGSTLLAALNYIETGYVALADETRTSFSSNISMMFSPLMKTGTAFANKDGVPWVEIEQGETLRNVMHGGHAAVFLNADQYGAAALIVNQLSRFFIYSELRRRDDDWFKDPNQKHVLVMIDECHLVIGQAETALITTLRSKGGMFFFLTQGINQLRGVAGFSEEEAYALLDQFANLGSLRTDEATVEYLARRAPDLWVSQGPASMGWSGTGVLDVEGAVAQLARSPLQNKKLEHASWYQRMRRHGFGAITVQNPDAQGRRGGNGHGMHSRAGSDGTKTAYLPYQQFNAVSQGRLLDENNNPVFERIEHAVKAEDIRANLVSKGDGSAFWLCTRGGAPRLDFVQLDGMSVSDIKNALPHKPTP
jgi:hypothetical protein